MHKNEAHAHATISPPPKISPITLIAAALLLSNVVKSQTQMPV